MINKDIIKEKVNSYVPYLATFYYVEIIFLMFFLNFIYGKIFAVCAGLVLTTILTFHVVGLFNKNNLNRKIQLYFMDIHFAFSIAYFFNRIFSGNDITSVDVYVIALRLILAAAEISAVLILTDRLIKTGYTD